VREKRPKRYGLVEERWWATGVDWWADSGCNGGEERKKKMGQKREEGPG
jgi:hypothetical protein